MPSQNRFFSLLGFVLGAVGISLFLLCPISMRAEEAKPEYELQAQWVVALIPYVTYPSNHIPINNLCIIDDQKVFYALQHTVSQGKRAYEIEARSASDTLKGCHLLYIGSNMSPAILRAILMKSNDLSILTMSSMRGFSNLGGIVELVRNGQSVRLRINMKTARENGLLFEGELLNYAEVIR